MSFKIKVIGRLQDVAHSSEKKALAQSEFEIDPRVITKNCGLAMGPSLTAVTNLITFSFTPVDALI